jgi:hypothetical protein
VVKEHKMTEYHIGQIFNKTYPGDAVFWCENNNAYIFEIAKQNNERRFQIKEQEPYVPTPEEINNLTMTPLDFIGVLQNFGLTLLQINEYLEANLTVKMQLTYCDKVYCGVAKALMPITFDGITITAEMVEKAFRDKHGV